MASIPFCVRGGTSHQIDTNIVCAYVIKWRKVKRVLCLTRGEVCWQWLWRLEKKIKFSLLLALSFLIKFVDKFVIILGNNFTQWMWNLTIYYWVTFFLIPTILIKILEDKKLIVTSSIKCIMHKKLISLWI